MLKSTANHSNQHAEQLLYKTCWRVQLTTQPNMPEQLLNKTDSTSMQKSQEVLIIYFLNGNLSKR